MQNYTEISDSTTLTASLSQILNNDKSIISDFSGTTFPTTNLLVGMNCLRTDLNKLYRLNSIAPDVWVLKIDYNKTVAYTSDIDSAVTALIDSAPSTLNTLAKLATAIGDDPAFATTLSAVIAALAPLASPTFTGTPRSVTAAAGTNSTQIATTAFVTAANNTLSATKANLNSPTFTGTPSAPTPGAGNNSTRLATTEFVGAAMPVGTIIDFAGSSAPTNYLLCPTVGTLVSRAAYPALFAAVGTAWGATDGFSNFTLPWFPANYAAVQADGNVGTQSVGEVISHTHTYIKRDGGSNPWWQYADSAMVSGYVPTQTSATGGAANLAAGARVLKCVKYQ